MESLSASCVAAVRRAQAQSVSQGGFLRFASFCRSKPPTISCIVPCREMGLGQKFCRSWMCANSQTERSQTLSGQSDNRTRTPRKNDMVELHRSDVFSFYRIDRPSLHACEWIEGVDLVVLVVAWVVGQGAVGIG